MERKISNKISAFKKKHPALNEGYHILMIIIGGLIAALGLEGFLIPNGFLDGGVTGIAIILSKLVEVPVGVLIGALNIPFILFVWHKVNVKTAFRTLIGVATLATATILMHSMDPWTTTDWVAFVGGGALLGVGIGIALNNSGALDGVEALASVLASKSSLNSAQIILFINFAIFIAAGFVMGWEAAMLSAGCFLAVVVTVLNKIHPNGLLSFTVSTTKPEEIAEALLEFTKHRLTVTQRDNWVANEGHVGTIYKLQFDLQALQQSVVEELIFSIDEDASIKTVVVASKVGGVPPEGAH